MKRRRIDNQNVKVTAETLRQVRVLAALLNERHYHVLARLVQAEYTRLMQQEQQRSHED